MPQKPELQTTVTAPTLRRLALADVTHEVRSLARWGSTVRTLNDAHFKRPEPGFAQAARAALGESAMLHLRAVVDFLEHDRPAEGDPNKATELVAAHYFKEPDQWKRQKSPFTGRERRDLNRHLAHLSTDRESRRHPPNAFAWSQVSSHVPDVLKLFEKFVSELSAENQERARWFDAALAAIANPWAMP